MTKKRNAGGNAPAVNDDLRRRIAEDLLTGMPRERVIQRLASAGIDGGLAIAEVERAEKSPYFAAAGLLQARLAKRDWLLANQAKLTAADAVPRIHAIEPERFFRDFYRAHRPVLLTGLIDHWPAMSKWSLDHFEATHGAALVRIQRDREINADYERNSAAHGREARFAEFIARLRGGETNDVYMTANNHDHNRQALAALWQDVGTIPGILHDEPGRDGFLWIGPKGTITPWHHDLTNNLLLQIAGTKRVRIAASHDTPLMRNTRHCFSAWTSEALGPGLAGPDRPAVLEIDIGPGEALFLPVGWWHHVESRDVTIGMSFTNFAADNDFYSHYASYGAL
jgi:ribosomal protein L16 Arg81 hydroxylase